MKKRFQYNCNEPSLLEKYVQNNDVLVIYDPERHIYMYRPLSPLEKKFLSR
jgi:hypothetical protein